MTKSVEKIDWNATDTQVGVAVGSFGVNVFFFNFHSLNIAYFNSIFSLIYLQAELSDVSKLHKRSVSGNLFPVPFIR